MRLTLQTISSPLISEILCLEDIDGIILDTEHGIFNLENLCSCIQVINLKSKLCFVRVTEFNKTLIRNVLDSGADGIVFSTIEEAFGHENLISYCNYPINYGKRGCGLTRENDWGSKPLGVKKPIIVAQIETIDAMENLDYICKSNFDYFFVGPYDLSNSLRVPGDFTNRSFKNSLEMIYQSIPKEKLGIFIPTSENALSLEDHLDNYSIYVVGMDTHFISMGLRSLNNKLQ